MKRAWRRLREVTTGIYKAMGRRTDKAIRESTKEIILPNGAEIWLRTAEKQESLSGEGIRGVVGDEFSLWKPTAWEEYLEATLLDYGGWAFLVGVPKGRNWATKLWLKADERRGWWRAHATTAQNPTLRRDLVDEIMASASDRIRRQEYLAEILADGGAVFQGFEKLVWTPPPGPQPGRTYYAGVDWGQVTDYTAVSIMDDRLMQVATDRFNRLPWQRIRDRIASLAGRWHARVILVEENSIGGPNAEALRRAKLPIRTFNTNTASKPELIEALSLAFERGRVRLIADRTQTDELQMFTAQRTRRGAWIYGAPSGYHDDTVIALAINLLAASKPRRMQTGHNKFFEED